MKVYTENNTALVLKEPALCSGGEGSVYEIIGYSNRVVKIYHDITDAKKREDKINAMVNISEESGFHREKISQNIAWPMAPIYDAKRNFIGFGMNRISADEELDDLYAYPANDNAISVKEKINILINLCDVIERLHNVGQVFGDFNPNNIKIKKDGTVCFVDADSYHVKNAGKEYRCVVCAPGYVAPEIIKACKGTNYEKCQTNTFTQYSDNFALAIHIFRMFMNGCHPFICERHLKKAGSAPAPKPLDKRVENGETPFFKQIPNYTVPHYAPDINALPPYIHELFKRAFVDGHLNPNKRPNAAEWKRVLTKYSGELKRCNSGNVKHYYWQNYHTCPYCEADSRHDTKMRKVLPQKTLSNHVATVTQPRTTSGSYVSQSAASSVKNASVTTTKDNTNLFWIISMTLVVLMQILFAVYLYPEVYFSFVDSESIVWICVGISFLSGVIGSAIYNGEWASGAKTGSYSWGDYVMTLLVSVGFSVGVVMAMGVAIMLLYLVMRLLMGLLALLFIITLFSGG